MEAIFAIVFRAKSPSAQGKTLTYLSDPWRLCAFARVYSSPESDLSPAKTQSSELLFFSFSSLRAISSSRFRNNVFDSAWQLAK